MSEGGGEEVKNGEVSEPIKDVPKTPEPEAIPPEAKGIEYDENGQMKPYICICPAKPPDVDEEKVNQTKAEDRTKGESVVKVEEGTKTEHTKESAKEEPPKETDTKALNKSFSEQFKLFSKFGDIKSDGRLLSLSQSDKWMKQAKVIDGKHITTTDTGIHFKKLKSIKVSETDYKKFLEDLAKTKKTTSEELKKKMVACGPPGLTSQTTASSNKQPGVKCPSAVDRLTDPSKYTGSHKQRFDETGKGRGIAGRKDLPDASGYVSGYMNKNTYDKKNPNK